MKHAPKVFTFLFVSGLLCTIGSPRQKERDTHQSEQALSHSPMNAPLVENGDRFGAVPRAKTASPQILQEESPALRNDTADDSVNENSQNEVGGQGVQLPEEIPLTSSPSIPDDEGQRLSDMTPEQENELMHDNYPTYLHELAAEDENADDGIPEADKESIQEAQQKVDQGVEDYLLQQEQSNEQNAQEP